MRQPDKHLSCRAAALYFPGHHREAAGLGRMAEENRFALEACKPHISASGQNGRLT
ncbi:hypothetical protein [Paenibacillus caui]|uniref:hypothetical protein n=1 Tax=Paenibacillus caui TaxID=2873927 RepID=UPI001CA7C711|nr:hypothetical protein [Paenibacillus caui]